MVTGAGGSIGSELCRQICRAAAGIAGDVRAVREQPARDPPGARRRLPAVGAPRSSATSPTRSRVADVFEQHQPEIVFHAAAHKHVPLMEENPCEAIKNNVRGTRLLAEAADATASIASS